MALDKTTKDTLDAIANMAQKDVDDKVILTEEDDAVEEHGGAA